MFPPWNSAIRYGVIALVLGAGLFSTSSPAFAFPETTSYHADETDAYPPTYVAEQYAAGDSQIWSAESIFYRPPTNDPASTLQAFGPTLGGHPGTDRFQRQSVRQRMRDFAKLLFPDIEGPFSAPEVSNNSTGPAGPARPSQPRGRSGSTADALLIDSGFSEFILDIVEPNVEPGGVIGMTIRGLGRFALLFSSVSGSTVSVDMDKKDSKGMPEGRNFKSSAATGITSQFRPRGTQVANNYESTNSLHSFLQKLQRLAIATLTHPGFIAFAIFGIGLLVLRRLSRRSG